MDFQGLKCPLSLKLLKLPTVHLKPNSVKNPIDGIILTALHNVVETSVEDVVPPRYLGYQDLFYLGGLEFNRKHRKEICITKISLACKK